MKFTSVLGLVFLVSGIVRAEKLDQCQELNDYLKGKVQSYRYICENNEEGKVQKLAFTDFVMTEEDFEKVLSYDTITDLSYSYEYEGRIEYAKNLITDIKYFTNLKNLKDLEKLHINYDVYDNPCTTRCLVYYLGTIKSDTFKDLKNLKELNIFGINLSQDNIDEIATLNNLETLKVDYCSFENVKDFSSLSHLEKVNTISATEGLNYFGGSESDKVPSDFINQFKNLKKLEVDKCTGINYNQHPDIERLSIDKEEDTSFLKNLKNLKSLTALPSNDLSVLEYVDSLEELEIVYIPSSYGFGSFPFQNSIFKFSENSHIKTLNLYGVMLTDETVNEILKLNNLNNLYVTYCDFSTVSEENINRLREFKNRCPFKSDYSANQYRIGYVSFEELEDINNTDCDHFTTVAVEPKPTEINEDPEPTEIDEVLEPTEIDEDPEETEVIDYEFPEATEVETEVDEQEPTEVPEPVVLVNPKQNFEKNTDEEDQSKAESSQAKKSHRRKCYVKNSY